jgi:hypothetical protein
VDNSRHPPFLPPPPTPPHLVHSLQPLNQPSSLETLSQHGSNGSDGPFVVSNPNTGERTHSLSKRTHSFSLLAVSTPKPLPNGQGRSSIPKLDEAVPAARRNLTLETRERVRVRVRACVYDVMCAEGEGRMHAGGGCIHVFMYV